MYLYICDPDIMRYVIGAFLLYCIGWMGGDILLSAIWLGIAYGFIDLMKQQKLWLIYNHEGIRA